MPRKTAKTQEPAARNRPIQSRVSDAEWSALVRLAARRTLESGEQVPVGDVVREAVLAYPPLRRELLGAEK